MDTRLINLQSVVNELGVSSSIDTLDERVTFQKTVYLAQAAGIPLRYRYSWYIRGPYSRDLTRDYYALNEVSESNANRATRQEIQEPFASALTSLKGAMIAPRDVPLEQKDWLELLSSIHFLRTRFGLDMASTQEELEVLKPQLSQYVGRATQLLVELKLIQE